MKKILALIIALTLVLSLAPAVASANGPLLVNSHSYSWTDPSSGGTIDIVENVYYIDSWDMKWEYVVTNIDYDPIPGITNGLAGFQIVFDNQVPELFGQAAPVVGGPWDMNAYSGTWPPFGVEWDTSLPNQGIMPGQTGVFSFHTYPRADIIQAAPDSWAHTWGLPVPEPIIDLDGTATAGPGGPADQQVAVGDPLIAWADAPTGGDEGIDWFDNDWDGVSPRSWSAVDDLHVEDPTHHPTANRDSLHDNNLTYVDPMVLDQGAPLPNGTQVSVDLEGNLDFFVGSGADPAMAFFDSNLDGFWNDGEDIVLDVNGDRIFGEVVNSQTYIFYGQHSIPGPRIPTAEKALLDSYNVDDPGDTTINVGEKWEFLMEITVNNNTGADLTDLVVKDNFGGDLELLEVGGEGVVQPTDKKDTWGNAGGDVSVLWTGKTLKAHLDWMIASLNDGESATLTVLVSTDINPGQDKNKDNGMNGKNEYTEEGTHCLNSGPTVYFVIDGYEASFTGNSICVEVQPAID